MTKTATNNRSIRTLTKPKGENLRLWAQMLKFMKLLSALIFIASMAVTARPSAQTVSLSMKDAPLLDVFEVVKKQTGYEVAVSLATLKKTHPVTVSVKNMPLEAFLVMMLQGQPITFQLERQSIFLRERNDKQLAESTTLLPQLQEDSAIKITGTVMDFNGLLLAGATIRVKGEKKATTSNTQGAFNISVESGSTLLISYAGFVTAEEKVSYSQHIVVKLEANALLEEAVVYNGYQRIQQKYLTGSVTSIRMDSIMQPGLSTVDKMLEGRVPGMMFMQNSGQAGAAPKLRIRGTNTYLGSREPLWVVDGIVRTNPIPVDPLRLNDPDFVNLLGNAISGLNPYDIEQIDVLKDATAAALYGVRAANGVIVITTKRGKPGPPIVNYNVTSTLTQRPRYTDRSIYMMDSRERVDVSREMIEKELKLRGGALEAYELAIIEYYKGKIDFNTFNQKVEKAETVNVDWLENTMRDVLASNHTLSVSGGSAAVSYRISGGYRAEPGVIKEERRDLYTGLINTQINYSKLRVEFNIQLNQEKRSYTPSEIGLLNYAYGTSRSIPLYKEDGSLYFYSTVNANSIVNDRKDLKTMNIVNEMNHTGERIENNEYNASADISYEIVKGIQFHSKLAYTGGNANRVVWFEENTEWVTQLRNNSYNILQGVFQPDSDPLPYGGELREQFVKRKNYIINGRLNFSRFLDQSEKHLLSMQVAADLSSNQNNSFEVKSRGYYPNRGHSFAEIDLVKYKNYASWLSREGKPIISENLQNAIRSYLTTTYIFDERYVFSATTSQEFSNSFGSRSNEKFLPTWAFSGRWNMNEDLLSRLSWVDRAALLVAFGTRGNMLPSQTPYSVFKKGSINTYYDDHSSSIISFPNPNLAWEKTQDYNGALQFTLLQGRINGSIGYFFTTTSNAFLQKKVSAVNGAPSNSYVVNGGTLENQGVEMSFNFKLIDNAGATNKKGFMWRFDPQLGQVFNRLLNNKLKSRNVLVDAATLTYMDFLNGNVPINGKSVNTFYSYSFKALDPNFGFPVFYGAEPENKVNLAAQYNRMTKEEVFSAVMVESGRREPVLQGAVNNSFIYGNWALNVTFTYSVGNKIRLLQIASGNYGTFRPSSQQNLRKEFTERWRYPGDEQFTNIPSINGEAIGVLQYDQFAWWGITPYGLRTYFADNYYQMYDYSDLRVVKGDYLKLQYVSISYRLPNELCRKLHCKGATALFSGTNLFTITNKALRGQDPSQSGSTPNMNLSIRPVFALNLNLSF